MDSLGDRMKKNYEDRFRFKLVRRMPVIMRLDGRAFHTLTAGCEKPFDVKFRGALCNAAICLMNNIQGAKIGYQQSDEVSFLLIDYDQLGTEAWFDYNVQKMVSVSASRMSVAFASFYTEKFATFDCRVFNLPKEEVCNYFIWRQKDWARNSLQMLARSHFSHRELLGKSSADMHEMLHTKGVNWAGLDLSLKNGIVIQDSEILAAPIFTENRNIIEDLLEPL